MKIGYIGFSVAMLQALIDSSDFQLISIICEEGRWTDELADILGENSAIAVYLVGNKEGLEVAVSNAGVDKFIMCSCGFILPESVTNCYQIINFHSGSLENNRGRTPVVNSILRGDSYTKMTAHVVGTAVDDGVEVSSRIVNISSEMDSCTLTQMLDEKIPEMLPEVHEYFMNGRIHPALGIYCQRLSKDAAELNFEENDINAVSRKIRSQAMYGGALSDEGRIKVMKISRQRWNKIGEDEGKLLYRYIVDLSLYKAR